MPRSAGQFQEEISNGQRQCGYAERAMIRSLLELIAITVHASIQFVRQIPMSIQAALLS